MPHRSRRATDKQMGKLHSLGIHYRNKPSLRLASVRIARAEAGIYKDRARKRRLQGTVVRYVEPGIPFQEGP